MHKHLYFICPTDHLESVINTTYRQENYYCTSLGNSITFDAKVVGQIHQLIETKKISRITFVLSNTNNIVGDALKNHDFVRIRGLDTFYDEILKQKSHSTLFGQSNHLSFLVSSYLNKKIKELQRKLNNVPNSLIKINGKIYIREKNTFKNIYSDLVCIEKHAFN